MGEFQYQPRLTNRLHPGTGQGNKLTKPKKAKIAMT